MTRVVQVGRPPYTESEILSLRKLEPLVHPDETLESFQVLVKSGIDVRPLADSIPDGFTLIRLESAGSFERLVQIVDRLLAPGGCAWDQKQTHQSLKKYLLEEVYEFIEAVDNEDRGAMKEELGDLILQPVMQAALASNENLFTLEDSINAICEKLVRRHPHVFGSETASTPEEVLKRWDEIKALEKNQSSDSPGSILDGVPKAMPSLLRALELSKRAARQGFEWNSLEDVFSKLDEELIELQAELNRKDQFRIKEELGDVLFTLVNIARWVEIDPEEALKSMSDRFSKRFAEMEKLANRPLTSLNAESWESLWTTVKASS